MYGVINNLLTTTFVLSEIIDTVLGEDDLNNDGYLSYAEYVLARRREEAKEDLDGRSWLVDQ